MREREGYQVPPQGLASLARELEGKEPQEVLRWAFREFHPRIVLACSFGGISGSALLDMAVRLQPDVRVFFLDTGLLFPEAYALREEVERRYGIKVQAFRCPLSLQEQEEEFGPELWRRDPDLCCRLRKVEPNRRALEGALAWITGLRRDQAPTRREVPVVQWDPLFRLVKVNPLATWSEARVWQYIRENGVPYNPLLERGYRSIGCIPCTRPVAPGEEPRAGRWSGTGKVECGLHLTPPTARW